jgi:Fe-S-cluster formation regulator IscX/YfhJ
METARPTRSVTTSTASELVLSIDVETTKHLNRETQVRLFDRFADLLQDWVVEGLEQTSQEVLGVALADVDYQTSTAVHLPLGRSRVGSLTVSLAMTWPAADVNGRVAFADLSAWLCDLLGSDDEPERWPRDLLVGDLALLRPLEFSLRRLHAGEPLPPLAGPIHLP